MICTLFRCTSLAAVLVAAASAAQAQELRLDCTMTDYSGLNRAKIDTKERAALDIRNLIPEHAVHVIDGESARVEGTDFYGTYSRDGRQRQLNYVTRVPTLGEARITYVYIISSGLITANVLFPKTGAFRHIDRIAGTCKRQHQ